MPISTWTEEAKRTDLGSSLWCPVTGWEAISTYWNRNHSLRTPQNTFYSKGDQALVQIAQKGCGVSILGDIPKPFGHGSVQPAWEEVLCQLTSRGPFKPQWYCDSVAFCLQTRTPVWKNWKFCHYYTGIQNMGLKPSTSGLIWSVSITQGAACVKQIFSQTTISPEVL